MLALADQLFDSHVEGVAAHIGGVGGVVRDDKQSARLFVMPQMQPNLHIDESSIVFSQRRRHDGDGVCV